MSLTSPTDSAAQTPIISAAGLVKHFDQVIALDGISFEVFPGELFGFLGPNGAGKTTTINILTGLAKPDAGSIRIAGQDCNRNPKAAQHLIGIVPDESNLYPELSGYDNLCFCAALYGLKKGERTARARQLLDMFGLSEAADRKFSAYSKGMKRKLTIAAGLIHQPPILFLDEPTTGIDVASARQIRQLVQELHSRGTTIFLTTHYIEEAERLCDRIAFIVNGKIVLIDTLSHLLQPIQSLNVLLLTIPAADENLVRQLEQAFPACTIQTPDKDHLRIESGEPIALAPLVRFLEQHQWQATEARRLRPSLEDVFIRVTGLQADLMKKEKEKTPGGSS